MVTSVKFDPEPRKLELKALIRFLCFFCFKLFNFGCVGLRCCMLAFSSCGRWGQLFVALRGLLIAMASCCGARALGVWASVVVACGLSSCGSWALEYRLSSCGPRA